MKIYSDFETTTNEKDQTHVWSAASIIEGSANKPENVHVQESIEDYFKFIFNIPVNDIRIYFHNLKFDGTFILHYLFKSKRFKPNYEYDANGEIIGFKDETGWKMKPGTFRFNISSKGQWYCITIRTRAQRIEIWDSLKLLPMPLKALGKAFGTEHQKLEMDYACDHVTKDNLAYIQNDVLVLKECMEYMFKQNIDKMTIGAACLAEYMAPITVADKERLFPDLTTIKIPDLDGHEELGRTKGRSADDFIRRSYHGGFCYVNPKYQGKKISTRTNDDADVIARSISHVDANSHYPSMMHSKSGNYYPVGMPIYVRSKDFSKIENVSPEKFYYFVHILCRFELKEEHLPMLQIKDDIRFAKESTDWLTSSHGYVCDLVLTCQDYRKFKENYDCEIEVLEAVMFETKTGLFDNYIDNWYKIKETSTGARRQLAKLFLNNIYGKFAASTDSSYKVAYIDPHKKCLKYKTVEAHDKMPGFIAIGSAITSYARLRTITLAETYLDYYVYSDTDSNVYLLPEEELDAIPKHPTAICYWGVESESDQAIFARQKTYIEHICKEDGKESAKWNIKACGMGKVSKINTEEKLKEGMSLKEFKKGFQVEGTLKARQVDGGTILVDVGYLMR
jgi:putative lipoic acid-binding regulatory protein